MKDQQSEGTFFDRDLSWLSFNERVLQEAKDPSVPLFDRHILFNYLINHLLIWPLPLSFSCSP